MQLNDTIQKAARIAIQYCCTHKQENTEEETKSKLKKISQKIEMLLNLN